MGIVRIEATVECDGCGKRFMVDVEPSKRCLFGVDQETGAAQGFVDASELAVESVRGGEWHEIIVRGQRTIARETTGDGSCSVQAGLCLCNECTAKCDAVPTVGAAGEHVERSLTEAEVRKALAP